ncbi:MAG: zinc-dependent peptidase [Opitutales bacterium]|nr:zinc-dependent peptidase [Opitutales bacterium]
MSIWETLKSLFLGDNPIEAVFKDEWISSLQHNLPLYAKLPPELQLSLLEKIGQFVSTTYFEGCGDLELTDEMIISVAGQACILILKHDGPPYPNLKTVLLYPSTFQSVVRERDPMGVVTEREVRRLGESWSNGTVILAWDSVQRGARNIQDGHNVTMHEFAHQLDQEDGNTDGVPFLESREAYRTWGAVLGDGYSKLVDRTERRKKTVLDKYGATNLAEYFAVATEAFFEKPRQMQRKRADLYEELKDYYQLDPVEWFSKG